MSKVAECREKRLRNEEKQDELVLNRQSIERSQNECGSLYWEEKHVVEELCADFHGTDSFYRYEDHIEDCRRSEYQFMEQLEEVGNSLNKRRQALDEENEDLYTKELALSKEEMKKEKSDGKS